MLIVDKNRNVRRKVILYIAAGVDGYITDENVEFFSGGIDRLIDNLRKRDGKHISCDGGAEIVFDLMKRDLIDDFKMAIVPVFVGRGIALFKSGRQQMNLQLVKSRPFPSGVIQLH